VIEAAALVAEARTWIGVPFVHQGRSRFGVDCVGLVLGVRNALEPWPEAMAEARTYRRKPEDGLMLMKALQYCRETDKPAAGVVALIRWPADTTASHVGILTPDTIIHAYERVGKVLEVGFRHPWDAWTEKYFRLPGVRYE
jgi:cell wall-associated NlpC family hydrolase